MAFVVSDKLLILYKIAFKSLKRIIKKYIILLLGDSNLLDFFNGNRKFIKGFNNRIINNGSLKNTKFDIVGSNNTIEIGSKSLLSNVLVFIRGDNHLLRIEDKCKFKEGEAWFEDNNCRIIIGSQTTIESAHIAVTEPGRRVVIGKKCMLATQVELRTGDSHSIIDNKTGDRINYAADIVLGNSVWLGARSVILKGVSIGSGSIIANSSVVTKNIPDNVVAAGIPAKIIKSDVSWIRERVYNES